MEEYSMSLKWSVEFVYVLAVGTYIVVFNLLYTI